MFRYYIIAIVTGTVLISWANELFLIPVTTLEPMTALVFTLLAVFECVVIDAAVAIIVRYCIPERFFNPLARRFTCAKWEKKLYIKLGIRAWKDKIPETGGLLVGFPKDRAIDLRNNKYVYKFMQETCYAEVMHFWSAFLGFCVLLLCPSQLVLTVALPVAAVNFVLQILPVVIQRFVRPQLLRVYRGNLKRESACACQPE